MPAIAMNKEKIVSRLRELSTDKTRSKAAQMRDLIDDIEAALAAGVTRAKVVDVLNENGLELTFATFETTLKRIRSKRGGKPVKPVQNPTPRKNEVKEPAALAVEVENEKPTGTHDRAALDAIMNSTPDLSALAKFTKNKGKT